MSEIINDGILRGYTNINTAYKVDDYPWGFKLRASIHYWIETKKGAGDRLGTYTIDPRSGRACKPKYSTYATFMYLYLDSDTGHVKHGQIDAYHMDEFEARFYFIINKIGEQFINEIQKDNLRTNYFQHVSGNAPYQAARYSDEKRPQFVEYIKNKLKHIGTCEFKDLVDFPEAPAEDKPEGEVKMTVTEYIPNNQ